MRLPFSFSKLYYSHPTFSHPLLKISFIVHIFSLSLPNFSFYLHFGCKSARRMVVARRGGSKNSNLSPCFSPTNCLTILKFSPFCCKTFCMGKLLVSLSLYWVGICLFYGCKWPFWTIISELAYIILNPVFIISKTLFLLPKILFYALRFFGKNALLTCFFALLTCFFGVLTCIFGVSTCIFGVSTCFFGVLTCLFGVLTCLHG